METTAITAINMVWQSLWLAVLIIVNYFFKIMLNTEVGEFIFLAVTVYDYQCSMK